MKGLKLSCVLDHVRASGREPTLIEATDVRFPAGSAAELKPGESATFKVPVPRAVRPAAAQPRTQRRPLRPDLLPRVDELPFFGSICLSDNSVPFALNTRLLPPRWTSKPEG